MKGKCDKCDRINMSFFPDLQPCWVYTLETYHIILFQAILHIKVFIDYMLSVAFTL